MSDIVRYFFVHNAMAGFYKSFLDYISSTVYSRFDTKLVSTYDKAVSYIANKEKLGGREQDKPNLPCLILNPSGELNLDDGNAGGKQLHRFSRWGNFGAQLWDPIYRDENVKINPVFGRLKGEIELIMLLNSFYEYCDLRVLFLEYFTGQDRDIKLDGFTTFIIIPKEMYNYEYYNDVTGERYNLDWSQYGVTEQLIKTTNKVEYIYPCTIKPLIRLTGTSDGSTKYGGVDKLADWRLTANFEFSVEIPWFMLLSTNYLANEIDLTISTSSTYSINSFKPPVNINITKTHYDFSIDSTSGIEIIVPDKAEITERKSGEFNTRYYHIITYSQALQEEFSISLPEIILDKDLLLVNSKYEKLDYGDDYIISEDGTVMTIYNPLMTRFSESDIIELYVYK